MDEREMAQDLGNRLIDEIALWMADNKLDWVTGRRISRIVLKSAIVMQPAQQEAGPRSKRHPKSVEGLRVKGEGE